MDFLYIILPALLYFLFVFNNFKRGLFVFILLFPAYVFRFTLLGLPSTVLEGAFGVLFLVWLIKYLKSDYLVIKSFFNLHRSFYYFLILFFISSVISIFISDMWWYSFGQWRAYFLEPLLLFLIIIGRSEVLNYRFYSRALMWSSLSVSLYAIIQIAFGFGTDENGRALSFFLSPNAVGLFLAPLFILNIGELLAKLKNSDSKLFYVLKSAEFWLLLASFVAILFTRSLGTIFGIFCASLVILIILNKRKLTTVLVLGAATLFLMMSFSGGISNQKSQSISNRFLLWNYTSNYLTNNPKNFIFGTGIRQFFRKVQKPHYNQKELERLIYPHNIFLNFWTEVGLLGMISFLIIYFELTKKLLALVNKQNNFFTLAYLGVLVALLAHGFIDVPYFKNDLAMMFWVLAGAIFTMDKKLT